MNFLKQITNSNSLFETFTAPLASASLISSHFHLTTTEVDLVEPQLQTRFCARGVVGGVRQCAVRSDGKWQAHRAEDGRLSPWLYLAQPGLIIASTGLIPGRGGPPFGTYKMIQKLKSGNNSQNKYE